MGDPLASAELPVIEGELGLGDFEPEGGGVIRDARLQYQVLGDPALGERHGSHLVFHALTGNARAQQWWGELTAPGGLLDASLRPVITANLLGGCYGSSGPADAADGSFPRLTTRDLARAHLRLIETLEITRLHTVSGGSLGGMVALQWGLVTPVPVERLIVFAAPARTGPQAIGWNAAQRMAIEADPAWKAGRYATGHGPASGLAAARAIAMVTYRSNLEFEQRFSRRQTRQPGRYDVDYYLRRHGEKLVERFDARSYVTLMDAIDSHDVGNASVAGWSTRERVKEVIGVGIDSDILYPAAEVRAWVEAYARGGANARYREIESPYGHDAFLIEQAQINRLIGER
jgi:homoserine O-acetyltransferase